jgi:Fe-Mn family superoxide dismutase
MSDVKELLDLADQLDEKGLEAEADLVERYLLKTARKGFHKCGLREETVTNHLELLEGYKKALEAHRKSVKKAMLSNNEKDSPNQGALREALRGIAHNENSVQLHEMYIEDIIECKPYDIERTRVLWPQIKERYVGTRNKFKGDLKRIAKLPRSGWVLVNFCTVTGNINLDIVDLHEIGHIATSVPILAIDLWEHAFFHDFGNDREEYLDWVLSRVDWRKPEKRLKRLLKIK